MSETMTLEQFEDDLRHWESLGVLSHARTNNWCKHIDAAITERDALRAEVARLRTIEQDAMRMVWLIVNACGGRVKVKQRDALDWRLTDILSQYPNMDGSVIFVAQHENPNDLEPPAARGRGDDASANRNPDALSLPRE